MSTIFRQSAFLSIATCLFLAGCGDGTSSDPGEIGFGCGAVVSPGIVIEVFDLETGDHNSCGSQALIVEGDYLEEIEPYPSGEFCNDSYMLMGAYERAGIYDVTVIKSGYLDWMRTGVEVTSNVCHVNTIKLQAYMEKQ